MLFSAIHHTLQKEPHAEPHTVKICRLGGITLECIDQIQQIVVHPKLVKLLQVFPSVGLFRLVPGKIVNILKPLINSL